MFEMTEIELPVQNSNYTSVVYYWRFLWLLSDINGIKKSAMLTLQLADVYERGPCQ